MVKFNLKYSLGEKKHFEKKIVRPKHFIWLWINTRQTYYTPKMCLNPQHHCQKHWSRIIVFRLKIENCLHLMSILNTIYKLHEITWMAMVAVVVAAVELFIITIRFDSIRFCPYRVLSSRYAITITATNYIQYINTYLYLLHKTIIALENWERVWNFVWRF